MVWKTQSKLAQLLKAAPAQHDCVDAICGDDAFDKCNGQAYYLSWDGAHKPRCCGISNIVHSVKLGLEGDLTFTSWSEMFRPSHFETSKNSSVLPVS